jgi:hypothetical protein
MRATIEDCSPINYESKMLQTLKGLLLFEVTSKL